MIKNESYLYKKRRLFITRFNNKKIIAFLRNRVMMEIIMFHME